MGDEDFLVKLIFLEMLFVEWDFEGLVYMKVFLE